MNADILSAIINDKRAELKRRQQQTNLDAICTRAANAQNTNPVRRFEEALRNAAARQCFPVIAELKRASPSKGIIKKNYTPAAIAREYQKGGAACLSVLTDTPYFMGDDKHLQQARAACDLPVLRKDFMIDKWQIYESRALGADAVLLICAILTITQMQNMAAIAQQFNMAVLVEAHNRQELQMALQIDHAIIGINNRNLKNFHTTLQTTMDLLPEIERHRLIVSESGIATAADIQLLTKAGVNAFLIGEALMQSESPALVLRKLFNK